MRVTCLFALALLLGCAEGVVAVVDTAPAVVLVEPVDGAVLTCGAVTTFRATIQDDVDEPASMEVLWVSDLDGVLGTASPFAGSGAEGEEVTWAQLRSGRLAVGDHLVTLSVLNSRGGSASSTVALQVVRNEPPGQVRILSPSGETVESGAEVAFSGFVSDPDDEVSALPVAWFSDRDGLLDEGSPGLDGSLGFSRTDLGLGEHSVQLLVTDAANQSVVATSSVTVVLGEVCNGRDDDGDGLVDEGFDSDGDMGQPGGMPDCFDAEECDGLDNDGDGDVDEGFEDADSDGIKDCQDTETCDGMDNDGDGETDEDYADTDGDGLKDCVETETCDGVDNDGDDEIDEGCP